MGLLVMIFRVVLALVFLVAGIAKLADREGARKSMVEFGAPKVLAPLLAWLVPVAELMCAVALFWAPGVSWGAAGLLAMLIVFSLAMAVVLASGRRPDCHCFGQVKATPIGAKTLARNAVLAAMAALVWWQGPRPVDAAGLFRDLSRPESSLPEIAVAFAILLGFQLWMQLVLLRQNGRLLLRVEALEKGGTVRPQKVERGLAPDTAAPAFSLASLDGDMVTLDSLTAQGKPVLLFFSEPSCKPCEGLMPEIATWQKELADRLLVVPVSRGRLEANRTRQALYDLKNVLIQEVKEVSEAYRVAGTPTAVLVADGKIASWLAEGDNDIRALVARASIPPPVKKGEPAPSLKMSDLDGERVDLGELRGRRRLLLFWNPGCGFCQQMLPDLKSWESNPPKDAPELLVISTGSQEAIRGQGFRSRVLIDNGSSAGGVFGAGGTPTAVLLDEEGRVASKVGVGAVEVMALAGAVAVAHR